MGRLAAATEMSDKVLRSRLGDPDSLRLGEIARIATALDVSHGDLIAGWVAMGDTRDGMNAEVAS